MEYKIEKGIPFPKHANRQRGLTATIRKMEIGDSILVPNKTQGSVWSVLSSMKPKKFTTRKDGTSTRIWRIK